LQLRQIFFTEGCTRILFPFIVYLARKTIRARVKS